jgi:ribonuclease HII
MDLFSFDANYYDKGFRVFAGVDEAGRGPWAGPVVAAAVIFPPHISIPGINDSKKLSAKQREEFFYKIHETALAIGVGIVGHTEIDSSNILKATFKAMEEAILSLQIKPELVLIDGSLKVPAIKIEQESIIAGDQKSAAIAASSIIAKVTRDRLMVEFSQKYPQYGFENHKGYGSKEHQTALLNFGPCEIHRKSFLPIKKLIRNLDG